MGFWEYFLDALRRKHGGIVPQCPAYTGPGSLRGVGVDYNWMNGVDYDKVFRTLAQYGCNGTSIEFWGWSGSYQMDRGLTPLLPAYYRALNAARKYGGILFISAANDNQGSGKYGDTRKRLEAYAPMLETQIDAIIAQGPANQWVQPVAETHTDWAKRFEERSIKKLNAAGFVTVYNRGSQPTAPAVWSDRNAYHPFKFTDVATEGDVIVTDTGAILSGYTIGGIYGKALNAAAVGSYARAVRKAGKRDLLIYTFTGVTKLDEEAVKAVGEAWK